VSRHIDHWTRGTAERIDHLLAAVLFVFSLTASLGYWFAEGFGVRLIGDATWPVEVCQTLTTEPGSLLSFGTITRLSFLTPYCVVYRATGGNLRIWILIQIVLYAAAVVLLYRIGRDASGRTAGLVTAGSAAVLWETFRFTLRPQADAFFIVALVFAIYALTRYLRDEWSLVWALGGIVVLVFARPVGPAVVLGWGLLSLLPAGSRFRLPLGFGRRGGALLVVALVVAIYSSELVSLTSGLEFNLYSFWERGIVVTHTTEPTYVYEYTPRPADSMVAFVLFNLDHLVVMGLLRVAWVFVPVLSRWSTLHIVVNLFTLLPVVAVGFVGLYDSVVSRATRPLQLWGVPFVMLLTVIAVTWLDGGFNYRAPITVLFALFCGFAVGERVESLVEMAGYRR